jgi:ABC-type transport system substrate-binding protein
VWPGGLVDGPEAAVPAFDPAAAGKLLDAAGWVDSDKDGYRDQNGKPLRLVLIGSEHATPKDLSGPPQKTDRDYFVDAARRAGVRIEVRTGSEAKRYEDGNYDLVEIRLGGMADMDVTPLLRERSPRVDHALDALAGVWEPGNRRKLAGELTAALGESWPLVGIVADAPHGLVHHRVKGVKVWDGWIDLSRLRLAD